MEEYNVTNAKRNFSFIMRQAIKGHASKIKHFEDTIYIVGEDYCSNLTDNDSEAKSYTSNVARDALCEVCYEVGDGNPVKVNRYNRGVYFLSEEDFNQATHTH